jgi:hypothetical protein
MSLNDLKKLRDQIREGLATAGEETRRLWQEIEPQLAKVEDNLVRSSEKAAGVSKTVAEELASAFQRIRDRVQEGSAEDPGTDEEPAEGSQEAEDAEVVEADIEEGETPSK